MTSIPIETARQDFDGLVDRVLAGPEPIVVSNSSGGSIVMVPLADFPSWQETAYLLGNPANAAHLRASIEQIKLGRVSERQLDEQ